MKKTGRESLNHEFWHIFSFLKPKLEVFLGFFFFLANVNLIKVHVSRYDTYH